MLLIFTAARAYNDADPITPRRHLRTGVTRMIGRIVLFHLDNNVRLPALVVNEFPQPAIEGAHQPPLLNLQVFTDGENTVASFVAGSPFVADLEHLRVAKEGHPGEWEKIFVAPAVWRTSVRHSADGEPGCWSNLPE